MTDQSSNRLVTNQLFNASVIGATVEDFSRNALLFPVQDLNITTNDSEGLQNVLQQTQTTPTPNTSVPFSNTLDSSTTLPPNKTPLGPSLAGQPGNLYRRSTTKKATYAQIPGLVSNHQQPYEFTNQPTSLIQPPQNNHQNSSLISYFQSTPKPPENVRASSGVLVPDATSASLDEFNAQSLPAASGALLIPTSSPDLSVPLAKLESLSSFYNLPSPQFNSNEIQGDRGSMTMATQIYRPVYHHWFYKHSVSGASLWTPFSMPDSLALEEAFTSSDLSPDTVVATDGNRYDVNVLRRERYAVYWEAVPCEVRRCSWFHKVTIDSTWVPFEENVAALLEEEYRVSMETNQWNRTVNLPSGEKVVLQGPDIFTRTSSKPVDDYWANSSSSGLSLSQGVLKRGMSEFDVSEGEPEEVDHLLFVVHGIGEFCDLKLRSVQEVVDEFRSVALKMMTTHFHSSGACNRVEILPISWHQSLHSEETGVDGLLKNITLESLPLLRDFTNNTLLDILFYTTPIYSQAIITSVSSDLNRIFNLFQLRNPSFKGAVSLIGHSLGSLILFDILSHQVTNYKEELVEQEVSPQEVDSVLDEDDDILTELKPVEKRLLIRRISNILLEAGAQPAKIIYPHLNFTPSALYALGSPIGVFMAVRGLDKFGPDFALPNCKAFFNIFHPYDPVAYRVEPLVNPELAKKKVSVIPHHTGRKRIHLELRDTLQKFQGNIKERVIGSVVSAFKRFMPGSTENNDDDQEDEYVEGSSRNLSEASNSSSGGNVNYGILNNGQCIDYVLQESPFELINEYIFAVGSHLCYWSSEDTVLFILNQTYGPMGISSVSPAQE